MLTFGDIAERVHREWESLRTGRADEGSLRQYELNGGRHTERPWRVTGFYARLSEDALLVYEALYVEPAQKCAVRVYSSDPLDFAFAKKASSGIPALDRALKEATVAFRERLPENPFPAHPAGRMADDPPLPAKFRQAVRLAWSPIPRPCDLDELAEA